MIVLFVMSCKPETKTNGAETATEATETRDQNRNNSNAIPVPNNAQKVGDPSRKGSPKTMMDKDGNSPKSKETNFNKEGIPDACDLLSTKTISRYVRQPAESIFMADGSSPQNQKARACFFKWDGSALANAGVMVQLQRNPVEEDVPEYFTYLISSKKTDGEKDPASDTVIKYKDWPGFGDDGAYSTVAGKYVWRVNNDWAFMIAFNTVLEAKAQKAAAEAFAKEVMSNMAM